VHAGDLVGAVAGDGLGAAVPARHAAVRIEHDQRVVLHAVDEEPEALLALAQRLLGDAAAAQLLLRVQQGAARREERGDLVDDPAGITVDAIGERQHTDELAAGTAQRRREERPRLGRARRPAAERQVEAVAVRADHGQAVHGGAEGIVEIVHLQALPPVTGQHGAVVVGGGAAGEGAADEERRAAGLGVTDAGDDAERAVGREHQRLEHAVERTALLRLGGVADPLRLREGQRVEDLVLPVQRALGAAARGGVGEQPQRHRPAADLDGLDGDLGHALDAIARAEAEVTVALRRAATDRAHDARRGGLVEPHLQLGGGRAAHLVLVVAGEEEERRVHAVPAAGVDVAHRDGERSVEEQAQERLA
jgi:hypothetical protein